MKVKQRQFAGLQLGLIPAWQYARPKLGPALRAGGRSATDSRQKHRAQNVLVVAQVALALVLLAFLGGPGAAVHLPHHVHHAHHHVASHFC